MAATAAPIDEATALRVARNQITQHIVLHGDWGGASNAEIASVRSIEHDGVVIGYLVTVAPNGFLLVAQDDDLPPVPIYAPQGKFEAANVSRKASLESWIMPEIRARQTFTARERLDLEQVSGEAAVQALREDSDIGRAWRFLNVEPSGFLPLQNGLNPKGILLKDATTTARKVGPLLNGGLTWSQGGSKGPFTYNLATPALPGCLHAVTGCVATAVSQIMKHWNWPERGTGSSSIAVNGSTKSLSHDIAFDWQNMPPTLEGPSATENGPPTVTASPRQIDAVATLMAHVGYAAQMQYGCDESGTGPESIVDALVSKFKYRDTIRRVERSGTSASEYFNLIRAELDASPARPVFAGMTATDNSGHAIVVDGYEVGVTNKLLLNMGWGGLANAFYDTSVNWTTNGTEWIPSTQIAFVGIQPDNICSYSLSRTSLSSPASGVTSSVSLSTGPSCNYSVSSSVSWISVSPSSGTGAQTLAISVAPNTTSATRSGSFSVGGKIFSVSQAGTAPCTYSVSFSALSYTSSATSSGFSISTSSTCQWSVAQSDVWVGANAWITFVSPTSGTGSGSVSFNVARNAGSQRIAELLVSGQTVRLTQAGACSYALSPTAQTIASDAQSGSFRLTAGANCSWTAVSSASWLSVTQSSGSGSATLNFSAAANTTSSTRSATVTVGRETFTLTQTGASLISTGITNGGFEQGRVKWVEQSSQVLVYKNPRDARSGSWYAWLGGINNASDTLSQTFVVPSNSTAVNASFWYKILTEETTGAFDTMKVEIWNSAGTSRLASLRTFSNSDATSAWKQSPAFDLSAFKGQTIRLVLTAATDPTKPTSFYLDDFALGVGGSTCTYSVSPASRSVTSAASTMQFNVVTNPTSGCPWTAVSASGWLTVALGANKNGTDGFIVVANENTNTSSRTGTVTIAGQTVSVIQAAPVVTPPVSNTVSGLQNPDFEQGGAFWMQSSSGGFDLIGADNLVPAKSGSSYARLGGYRNANDTLSQLVNVPANTTGAVLNFWYRIRTDKTSTTALDFATARLVDPATGDFEELDSVSNLDASNEWQKSPDYVATPEQVAYFKGKTVRFEVTARTDGGAITAFYIDDIRVDFAAVTQRQPVSSAVQSNVFGDGRSTLVWRNANGAVTLWRNNGTGFVDTGVTFGPYPGWTLISSDGDFDGDGRSDLLWLRTDGAISIWLMNGTEVKSQSLAGPYAGWSFFSGDNDFDGDGKTDLIWQRTDGAISLWTMNGGTLAQERTHGPFAGWSLLSGNSDFDGDGKSDLLWKKNTGAVSLWLMNGVNTKQVSPEYGPYPGWTVISGSSDYNGDGKTDLTWEKSDNAVSVWLMNGVTKTAESAQFGPYSGWRVLSGRRDFDGDGKSDLLWQRTDGAASVWLMNGVSSPPNASISAAILPGGSGWQLLPTRTDFNGDGKTDLVWQTPAGQVAIGLANGVVPPAPAQFGPYAGWSHFVGRASP